MYGKLFVQMYDSSIVEDPEARYTLMDMVVLADQNGVVDMTHEAIARRTNRPVQVIRETISRLESPDHRSRNPVEKGARLKRLDDHRDWGWMIVNHEHFRRLVSSEQKREKTAARVRRFRECNASVTLCNASNAKQKQKQDTEAEAEANKEVPPNPLKGEVLNRVKKLFKKRDSTPLDRSEQKAWKEAQASVEATSDEEWQLLEWAYSRRTGDAFTFRRKNMATLLNNWNGEIDRARVWAGRGGFRFSSSRKLSYDKPQSTDADFKAAGAVAAQWVAELKKQIGAI